MKKQNKLQSLAAMALVVLVVLACTAGDETDKANKLVEDGNAAVRDAKKFVSDAEELRQKMLHTDVSHLAEARTIAKETIAAYEKAEAKCKEAASKFDEASKLKLKDKFKEYLALKAKEFNKRAEMVETAKGTPQALLDVENRASFVTRANATNEKVDKLDKDADAIGAEADKLQKDNPDTIKS
jgi:hypothetical protein